MYRKPSTTRKPATKRSAKDEATPVVVSPASTRVWKIAVRDSLLPWFSKNARKLPWRKKRTPYRVWVSEIMLQQTRVATVIPYFEQWMKTYPDIQSLANADLQEVLKTWEGLGYNSRARMLHRAAQIVINEHHGKLPDNTTGLRKLPGIGDYTAAAIMAFAYRQPEIAVDGNIARVVSRWLTFPVSYTDKGAPDLFRNLLTKIFTPDSTPDAVEATMELGATICTPSSPQCELCPFMKVCRAYCTKTVEEFPPQRRKIATPLYNIAVGLLVRNGELLMGLRKRDGFLGGLWELPGGKCEPGETPEVALVREFYEETGLRVAIEKPLPMVKHAFTHFRIQLYPFAVTAVNGTLTAHSAEKLNWIDKTKLQRIPLPKATKLVLREYGW